jgi:hypothetical protein
LENEDEWQKATSTSHWDLKASSPSHGASNSMFFIPSNKEA